MGYRLFRLGHVERMIEMSTALEGIRVLELGGAADFAVPYAGLLLADLGADVILVEDETGHPLRTGHPALPPDPVVHGAVFDFLNTGKRSVTIDYSTPGNAELTALVASSHIILTTLFPEEFAALGLKLSSDQALAIVHVTPWGATGPYRDRPATSLIVQAAAGWVTSRKEVVMEPVQVGGQMHEWATGAFISTSALTAHRAAQQQHQPITVDFSEFEATHSMLCYDRLRYDARGELGVPRDRILISPFGIRRCADGWVGINTLTQGQWEDACRMTGLEDYYGFMQEMNRGEGPLDEFSVKVDAFLADKTVADLVTLGQSMRVPTIPVTQGKEMFALAQWQERPFFYQTTESDATHLVPGPPWRLSKTPARQSTLAGK